MKYILLSFGIILLSSSPARAQTQWSCSTHPLTTSFVFSKADDRFRITVLHHNGVEFMPIHSGTVTPYDLRRLATRGELLKKLGQQVQFNFAAEDCETFGDWRMSCWSSEKQVIEGIEVRSSYLTTSTITTKIFDTTFESIKVHLSLGIGNTYYDIPMVYQKAQCLENSN